MIYHRLEYYLRIILFITYSIIHTLLVSSLTTFSAALVLRFHKC